MKRLLYTALILLAFIANPAFSHDVKEGDIQIDHPWMRMVPVPGMNGAGYMNLVNATDKPDRLIAVKGDWAKKFEIHETRDNNGMMEMSPVPQGVLLPSGERVELQPAGYHVMIMKIERQIRPGERMPVTLVFENAGEIDTFIVAQPLSGDERQHH
ncbi:copper chaperone PCu(A)C [Hahella ganghwensis]|uniref:copper chaperone PCu(A)C n=1 Tax=Hahella ganghwensis TaxID=286420 RepID=UPI00035FD586|nr:copper chaperone PCu(A)C [Hahella ganghwensis]